MEESYILGIDQGTSGTKVILFSEEGRVARRIDKSHRQTYPQPGWVEHDPMEIYEAVIDGISDLVSSVAIDHNTIKALSVSNQRETVLLWDRVSGEPVYNALVWQCNRAEEICSRNEIRQSASMVQERTGLILSPYFSAAKIAWLFEHIDGLYGRAKQGNILCGTIDTWLIWKLTRGNVHGTDYSNASRTQLFNIHTLTWDRDVLRLFNIPENIMPRVCHSDHIFGETDCEGTLSCSVPICGVMGDSHGALFGQTCFEEGMVKATYGTGSSVMMNIGSTPLVSEKGLVTSLAWGCGGKVEYVFEGNINCSGATIKWLVDDLELIENASEAERHARKVDDNGGVYLVPAFVGLGAPYWESKAQAIITGLTRGSTKAHVVRAAIESIAYQISDIVELMAGESGIPIRELRVDGGAAQNNLLMQFQSDILDLQVSRSSIEELSSLGATYMAGLTVGLWKDREEIKRLNNTHKHFTPKMDTEVRNSLHGGWKKAVAQVISGVS